VTLVLKVVSGSAAGTMVATKTIAIVVPSSAHIVRQPGTNIRHTQGKASVGFKGQIFLAPKDVSFVNIQFREGHAVGSATGFLAFKNGEIHNETPSWLPVGNGNSSTGCLAAIDTISTGDYSGPFSNGQFLWPIPWRQRVGSNPETVFMTANHQENVDPTGKATIQKAGSGPFSRALNDPTVTF